MTREPREQERQARDPGLDDLEPRGVARAPRRAVAEPEASSWLERNWVSVVGVTVGLLVSLWRFGGLHANRVAGGNFPAAEFHWHGPVVAGHQVEIKGMSGAIRAVAADGNEVEVTAIKRSRGMNPAEVPIAVIKHDGGDVTFCAAVRDAADQCAEGDDVGRGGGMNIEYTVHVPKGVRFAAHTVNGGITVEGLAAAVELETVNGGIELSTSGGAKAETVNGSIRAAVGSTTEDLSFETVNGSIGVAMPENAAVDVRAETLSGSITSDFALNIEKAKPGQQKTASGRIGAGGHELKMTTVNGSIALHKASRGGPIPRVPPRGPARNRERTR